ncbi:MAG: FAD-dependent oxidoreductase [Candidatus Electrothrix sp. YB6]
MSKRIGFYICHCGINIAYRVRVQEVAEYATTLPGVVVGRDYLFMCSDPGQELVETDIKEHNLDCVVVASCSPRMHEKTFRAACQRAGLNPYKAFHMVCVREHVSWVTEDEDEATEKAKTVVRAGITRVTRQSPLIPSKFSVNTNTLVVGGGIAGMQASLDIAKAGYKVYLVEKGSTVGNHMLQYDKTFPTLDCAACIGTPKMVAVGQHPNIELITHAEVEEVEGFVGNFKVKVDKKPRYVKEGICTGCGDCAKVCPITRPNEWDVGIADRKAIYRSFPQAVPITYIIDKKGTAPCKATCPAHVSIQGFIALMELGKYKEAVRLFKKEHPFPATCGRVCHHPCEGACTRGDADQPMAIQHLHRYLADLDLAADEPYLPEVAEKREEKVAVVGSGPAGLTAAYYLAQKGYQVTIFEKLPVKGGMMAVGIPEYRLPQDILAKEIGMIEKLGVEIKTNTALGRDVTTEGLRKEGYKALFIGTGLHGSRALGVPGEDMQGILPGVAFLRNVALGRDMAVGKEVIVIGGGNVAVDVALTAKRVGAENVTLICLEKRDEMPAWDYEVEEALEEKVEIINSLGPKQFIGKDNICSGVEFKRCTAVFDADGAFRPQYDEGELTTLNADTVIVAIGQSAELDFTDDQNIAVTNRGGLDVDPLTLQSPKSWIFAGGDAVYGPRSVVEAIESGKQAAESIDRFLNGKSLEEGRERTWEYVKPELNGTKMMKRERPARLPLKERNGNFREILSSLTEEQVQREVRRCLECAVCSECYQCVDACMPKAIDHDMQPEKLELDVGSIVVATGFDLMDPTPMSQYGYGRHRNVFTSFEFERLSNATGPTSGKIRIRDDQGEFTKIPKSVAILHCIGSRDINHHEYCSRVCCMYALKFAHLLKDKCGHDTQVYNFYIDMRCFGKGYEEFYQKVQAEGVRMIRGKAGQINELEDKTLVVRAEDTLSGRMVEINVEMAILCMAIEPRKDALDVARTFGISTGPSGFFQEEHPKMEPVSTPSSGVFLAGVCQGPKDIPDTVAQAKGAASECLALSSSGTVEISPMVSGIDPDICIGCQACIGLCAYGAITFNAYKGVSEVNEAVCKGCGSCAGHCPSGAAKVKHFTDRQVFAEIDGLLQ